MKNFKQYINENNIDINKIKKECKNINPNIDYLSSNWEKKFIDNINWEKISKNQELSEEFIEYFKNYVNWKYISKYQNLSESFIEKYKDKVDWYYISWYQKLSKDFITRFKNKLIFEFIIDNHKIPSDVLLDIFYLFDNVSKITLPQWRQLNLKFYIKWKKYMKIFQ